MRSFVLAAFVLSAIVFSSSRRAAAQGLLFERLTIASHEKVKMNCYPCMAQLDDGRLMVVWSPSGSKGHRIVGAFSADHGQTWSEPVDLIQTPGGRDYDPSILVSGRRIFVSSTTLPVGGGIRTSTTWCTRSDDGAKTWSDLYKIPMNHRYTCGKTHHGLRLNSGILLLGYSWDVICEEGKTLHSEGEMHLRAGVMRSTDDGQSWQNGGDTDAEYQKVSGGAVHGTDEPAIVELEDGSIYMLMRTGSTHLYEARSADEGKTWTEVGPSPLRGTNAPAALCKFEVDGGRGIMCVWDNAVSRFPLCAAASFDGGRSWSRPKDIAGPTGGRQASYPGCDQAADGTLVAVWQQDVAGGRDVRCARFNLAWLLDDPVNALQKELPGVKLPEIIGPAIGYCCGDPVKASPSWTVHADGGVAGDEGLRLTVSGGYYVDDRPDVWDGTKDRLVEFRMCVLSREKAAGAHSAAEIWIGSPKPNMSCQMFLREDAAAFDASYSPAYRIDATKTHTYRLLTDVATSKAYLFLDDCKTPVLATRLGAPEGLNVNRILFGDSSIGSPAVAGTSQWEFVRWSEVSAE